MISFLKKAKQFVGDDLWQKQENEVSSRKEWWLVRQVRLVLYTARGVKNHNTVVRSAALTFFTLMSLVPMLALAFGVIKGFGMESALETYLYERYPDNSEMISSILSFANTVIMRTSGGLVAISGFLVLIWVTVRVFSNIENAFNTIWEVKRPRTITHRASTYTAVIFIIPILTVILVVILSYIRNLINNFSLIPYSILYAIGSFVLLWLMFAAIYKIIPNTKVKFRYAAMSGFLGAIAFSIFQLVYVALQQGVSSYNIIYGSFAAVPLFLLWIQSSWQILLFGAELSFSFQNVENFVQEQNAENLNYDNRRKVMMASLLVIIRSYINNEGGITSTDISHKLKLPLRLIRDVVYTLNEAEIVVAITSEKSQKTKMYIPARDIHTMTFYNTIRAVEQLGTHIEPMHENHDLRRVSQLLDEITEGVSESAENMPLIDMLHDEHNNNRKR